MHYHLVEKLTGEPPRDVDGDGALQHSGSGPVFLDYATGRAAAGYAARLAWGPVAESAVVDGLDLAAAPSPLGAVAHWHDLPTRSGASWVLAACDCIEGTIVELLHAQDR